MLSIGQLVFMSQINGRDLFCATDNMRLRELSVARCAAVEAKPRLLGANPRSSVGAGAIFIHANHARVKRARHYFRVLRFTKDGAAKTKRTCVG